MEEQLFKGRLTPFCASAASRFLISYGKVFKVNVSEKQKFLYRPCNCEAYEDSNIDIKELFGHLLKI